jgi:uncharacterized protein
MGKTTTTRTTRTKSRTKSTSERLEAAEQRLRALIASYDSLIVAFSGGVDSAYLAWVATEVLGPAALCLTADSPSYPDHHRQLARRLARDFRLNHEFVETAEIDRPEYRANPVNRCYYCKHELYEVLARIASDRGVRMIADGSNADDRSDHRPGRQAAREFAVQSPLDEVGLTKDDIRELSRRAGLPTWDEPASACLSSRIPYHSEVTPEKLRMIEHAETVLRGLGFRVCRVRHHDGTPAAGGVEERRQGVPADRAQGAPLARLEIGRDEMARALEPEIRERIVRELRAIGYATVTIDLQGYRMGSLNEGVLLRPA